MVRRCVVQFCRNSNKTGHTMHKFPKKHEFEATTGEIFVQVKRADFVEPSVHSVICSNHFSPDCYENSYMAEIGRTKKKQLLSCAVPKIHAHPETKSFEVKKRPMAECEEPEVSDRTEKKPSRSRALQKLEATRVRKIIDLSTNLQIDTK